MIRRGRAEGWLSLSAESLSPFLRLNGIRTSSVKASSTAGRGTGLIATKPLKQNDNPLISIPADVGLSKESVLIHAKSDEKLREVLEACGDFASTPRHCILIFLLIQATYSCPDAPRVVGVQHAFTNYIKFLSMELLPTFWTEDEMMLAQGTTLKPATDAKISSLYREYEQLRKLTSSVPWCNETWWDSIDGILEFDDWKQVDAMYRSRALEFPGVGDAMVPYLDFANHASGEQTSASYQADEEGNCLLLLHDNKEVDEGQEVTITYGDEKGACEMIFSYGFLEEKTDNANTLFLDISMPEDDPLLRAKHAWTHCVPAVRLTIKDGRVDWESDFLWLMIINEEDGLEFVLANTVTGDLGLKVQWQQREVENIKHLQREIHASPQSEIFQLRVVAIVGARIDEQLEALAATEQQVDTHATNTRDQPRALAQRLRHLERRLLEACAIHFAEEQSRLVATQTVQDYLQAQQSLEDEDDFS